MSAANRRNVPIALGRRVRQRARHRCGYCLCSETLLGMPMEFDHLIPQAAGGTTRAENLWLACRRSNAFKGTQTQARDPQSGDWVALFNPRRQLGSIYADSNGQRLVKRRKFVMGQGANERSQR